LPNAVLNVIGLLYTVDSVTGHAFALVAAALLCDLVVLTGDGPAGLWREVLACCEFARALLNVNFGRCVRILVQGQLDIPEGLPAEWNVAACPDQSIVIGPRPKVNRKTTDVVGILRKSAGLFRLWADLKLAPSRGLFEMSKRMEKVSREEAVRLLGLARTFGDPAAAAYVDPDKQFSDACDLEASGELGTAAKIWDSLRDERSMEKLFYNLRSLDLKLLRRLTHFWRSRDPLKAWQCYRVYCRSGHDFGLYRLVLIACQKVVEPVEETLVQRAISECNAQLLEARLPSASAFLALGLRFYRGRKEKVDLVYEYLRDGILASETETPESAAAQQYLKDLLMKNPFQAGIDAKRYEIAVLINEFAPNGFTKSERAWLWMEYVDDPAHPEYDVLTGDLLLESKPDRAAEFYQRAIERRPDNWDYKGKLGIATQDRKLIETALANGSPTLQARFARNIIEKWKDLEAEEARAIQLLAAAAT
jgi:hypothetical protein